ncbi:MAG: inorganic phosphate transporter, partial [Solirubrobacteraceae bacterium]
IIKMDPCQGFVAQTSGAAVILAASSVGFPLSTTQVITPGIAGSGAAKRLSAVRWGIAGEIVTAWLVTLPCAAIVAGAIYAIVQLFGRGDLGPIVVSVAGVALLVSLFMRKLRESRPAPAQP